MKKAVILGGGGFIGGHLAKHLKSKGYLVHGVDRKYHEFRDGNEFDIFTIADLRNFVLCRKVIRGADEVYQLAAEMGGMGFIGNEHIASLHSSDLINIRVPMACIQTGVKKLFFSSSVCVYPVHILDTGAKLDESEAFPANPNEAYGWEKLTAEYRYLAYQKQYGLKVRIARFDNTYGPFGTYDGGREKAPAALCRKVALAKDGDEIEVWGDGNQTRHFLYVEDLVKGIDKLMQSNIDTPVNLGTDETVTINQLAQLIIKISGKDLKIKNIDGPVGNKKRYIDHSMAKEKLGWEAQTKLKDGIRRTYEWIEKQYQ